MAKLTIGQKAERVLKLLYGLRNRRIAGALGAYGFSEADLDEGWNRLRALTTGRLRHQTRTVDPKLYELLDEWENRWFPIASASLRFRFPEAHDWLFLNLTQTAGLQVVVSVGTFVERIEKLSSAQVPRAAESRAFLSARGLTEVVLGEAKRLLSQIQGVAAPAPPPEAPSLEEQKAAEDALWQWYLEWSQIARTVIHDGRLLRALGFGRTSPTKTGEGASDETDIEDELADDGSDDLELDGESVSGPSVLSPDTPGAQLGME